MNKSWILKSSAPPIRFNVLAFRFSRLSLLQENDVFVALAENPAGQKTVTYEDQVRVGENAAYDNWLLC